MGTFPLFNKARLRYGAHFAVMTSFGEKVAPLAESESMLTGAYNEFTAALNSEDAAIKIARASEYSEQIQKEDNKRDRLYNNGKATSEMWAALGIEPMATAAATVLREFDNYRLDTTAQYDQETGLMLNFLQPFESAAMKQNLQTLGLTTVFEQMKLANDEVRRLISLRGDERAANAAFDLKKARQATDAAYDKLAERINALQILDDTGKFDTFIAWWTQEVARIKQQILSQKSDSSESGSSGSSDSSSSSGSSGSSDSSSSSDSSGSSDTGSSDTGGSDNTGGNTGGSGSDDGGGDVNAGFDVG